MHRELTDAVVARAGAGAAMLPCDSLTGLPSPRRQRRVVASLIATLVVALSISGTTPPTGASTVVRHHPRIVGGRCPWVVESQLHLSSPHALALDVVHHMTLAEEIGFVSLRNANGVENYNVAVPRLCVPALTLSDGPSGLAGNLAGVTQLPDPIALAATFNVALARSVGVVLGSEARTKGVDVVQAPELNLARVPQSGRIFETLGEDPFLTSALGVAEIEGIQSRGVMALAKHFSAYTQETNRARLNQIVDPRALAELYNAPFVAAVALAHVAAIMCSVGSLNGVRDCASPYIYGTLKSWGFRGFVRSDLRAAPSPAAAFAAGLDLIKPARPATMATLVRRGALPRRDLTRAVTAVLTEMFAYGLVAHPRPLRVGTPASSASHVAVALRVAEQSIVLLKNHASLLPLSPALASLAVIGTDAATNPQVSGGGSSRVTSPFVISPLTALGAAMGAGTRITYSPGPPPAPTLHPLDDRISLAAGLVELRAYPRAPGRPVASGLYVERPSNVTSEVATAPAPGHGRGWSHWSARLRVRRSGLYEFAVRQFGDTWFFLDGRRLVASPGLHIPWTTVSAVKLRAGATYSLRATWFSVIHHGAPELGATNVSSQIAAAAATARRAKVAVVFVAQPSSEGVDQSSLDLYGAENALVSAVAAANPHTVVVLNTGGPVVMPWLDHVGAVLEAWYPGEVDGRAIAAVLSGGVDPSGRLPLTFPASASAQPIASPAQFPGVNSTVSFGSGSSALDVGYRWYQSHRVRPLFPFGFGLDYTNFQLNHLTIRRAKSGVTASLRVTNTGQRSGADVVELYVHYPAAADEPPNQLRAFATVTLAPGATRVVTLHVARTGFRTFLNGAFTTVAGNYAINVGQSSGNLTLSGTVYLR